MKPQRHKCSGITRRGHLCVFNGCRHEDGKWWCEIHAPSMAEAAKARCRKQGFPKKAPQ